MSIGSPSGTPKLRTASAALVTLLSLSALASPPEPGTPCDLDTSRNAAFEVHSVWVKGRGEHALEQAKRDAEQQFMDRQCRGYSDLSDWRCAAIQRRLVFFKPSYDRKTKQACISVGIERAELRQLEQDSARFESDVQALARALVQRAGGTPVYFSPPVWSDSRCVASGIGPVIGARVTALLGHMGDVHVASRLTRESGELKVELAAAASAETVTVTATWLPPGRREGLLLPGFTFPRDLFNVSAGEVGACLPDRRIQHWTGSRVGEDGLVVSLDLESSYGRVCEGMAVDIGVRATQAARIRLFSVAPDGRAWLVWPVKAASDRVAAGSTDLGKMDFYRLPGGGDEKLVAAAIPDGDDWEGISRWQGSCQVEGGVDALSPPARAVISTTPFQVSAPGEAGCPADTTFDPRMLQKALDVLPVCGR